MNSRSYEKELLDVAEIPASDLNRNLLELDLINKYLGGYKASRNGLKNILEKHKEVSVILDLGFGGGDFIKQLSLYTQKQDKEIFFYGVDLKKDCVNYAENNLSGIRNKLLIQNDYRNISDELLSEVHLVHCSLFLHHLNDEEIIELFKFCKLKNCMLLANDLHRHWLACFSIKFLTQLFSKSYLVKNDAPLSVKRGFRKSELTNMLQKAGYTNYSVKWRWAFRYIITAEA